MSYTDVTFASTEIESADLNQVHTNTTHVRGEASFVPIATPSGGFSSNQGSHVRLFFDAILIDVIYSYQYPYTLRNQDFSILSEGVHFYYMSEHFGDETTTSGVYKNYFYKHADMKKFTIKLVEGCSGIVVAHRGNAWW